MAPVAGRTAATGLNYPQPGANGYVANRANAGTKTDTPVIENPQSVSTVTRQEIETYRPATVSQAVRYEAGVTSEVLGADSKQDDQITVRGFPASTYQDGLRILQGTFVSSSTDPYMLERIDILKGATGALYGQSYPGGIVDLVSKRPTEQPFHEVIIQGGSFGRIQGGFDFSGPVDAEKHWLYRVTGTGFNSGTQVDFTNLSRVAIAPTITYRPDAATTVTVYANYRYDPNAGFWNKLPALGSLKPNAAGYTIPDNFFTGDLGFQKLESTQAAVGYEFEHKFDQILTVRQKLRYQYMNWVFDSVQGGRLTGTSLARDKFQDLNSSSGVVMDNQAQADLNFWGFRHKVLLGVDYQNAVFKQKDTDVDVGPIDILNPNFRQTLPDYVAGDTYLNVRQTLEQLGVYAQDQIAFGGWRATLGIREDLTHQSTTNYLASNGTTGQNDHATTYRAGLLYLFDNGVAPYVSYSTSYNPTVGTDAYSNPFKPTTGEQYEVGVKYQPTFMNALITASVFDLTQQNVLTSDPANINNRIQTGEIRTRGAEFQIKSNIDANWGVLASYTYLDSVVTAANDGTLGFRTWAIPHNSASVWVDYTFTSPILAGLKLGGGVRYVGETTDQSNTLSIPDFTVFDAAIIYDFGARNRELRGLSLALNGSNLTDKSYIRQCVNGCYYGLRRTVLATLKYNW